MFEALANAFSGTAWPYALVGYVAIGFFVTQPTGGFGSRVMSAIGWPIEVMQNVTGSRLLPYLFLIPNLLIFGLYTFAPLFINIGFAVTDGQSINFPQREFSGTDNFERLTSDVQIDTGGENREDDKFQQAVADTAHPPSYRCKWCQHPKQVLVCEHHF